MSRRVIETVIIETPASEPIWGLKGNKVSVDTDEVVILGKNCRVWAGMPEHKYTPAH